MAVHDRVLVRAVVHFQNPRLGVFAHYRVMLGINLDRILSREDRDETDAQHHTIKRQWHSHFALLELRGFVGKAPYPTLAVSTMSMVMETGDHPVLLKDAGGRGIPGGGVGWGAPPGSEKRGAWGAPPAQKRDPSRRCRYARGDRLL